MKKLHFIIEIDSSAENAYSIVLGINNKNTYYNGQQNSTPLHFKFSPLTIQARLITFIN